MIQQRIGSIGESFEEAMKIEAMVGYPRTPKVLKPIGENNLIQI